MGNEVTWLAQWKEIQIFFKVTQSQKSQKKSHFYHETKNSKFLYSMEKPDPLNEKIWKFFSSLIKIEISIFFVYIILIFDVLYFKQQPAPLKKNKIKCVYLEKILYD